MITLANLEVVLRELHYIYKRFEKKDIYKRIPCI